MWPNKGNHPSLGLSVRRNDAIYMKHKPQNTDTLLHSLAMWHHCLHEPGQVSTHYSIGVTFIRNYSKLFSHPCIIIRKAGFYFFCQQLRNEKLHGIFVLVKTYFSHCRNKKYNYLSLTPSKKWGRLCTSMEGDFRMWSTDPQGDFQGVSEKKKIIIIEKMFLYNMHLHIILLYIYFYILNSPSLQCTCAQKQFQHSFQFAHKLFCKASMERYLLCNYAIIIKDVSLSLIYIYIQTHTHVNLIQ